MLSGRAGTFGRRSGAAKLPDARKCQPRVNAERAENFFVASEHVAQSGQWAGRGFCERHAPGAAAGAVTERSRLQHKDGPPGCKPTQPGRSGKAGEATANNGEIYKIRKSTRGGTEINRPRRRAPGMRFAGHGISLMQREHDAWREFPRLHNNAHCSTALANAGRWRSSLLSDRYVVARHSWFPSWGIAERHDDSRSPGCCAARTVDDDVHFRDQRDWEGTWMVRERAVHEHEALAADSGAAGDSDGD